MSIAEQFATKRRSVQPLNAIARYTRRTVVYALAALALTTIHHLYEGVIYGMPERALHVTVISVLAAGMLVWAGRVLCAPVSASERGALWVLGGITVFVVVGIGLFESGYGHVAKNAFYCARVSAATIRRFFPSQMWSRPNNVFFEATGVLQILPSAAAGYYFIRLLLERRASRAP